MKTESLSVLSADNVHSLYTRLYLPDDPPKAVFQLVHGMCEYEERYRPLFEYLTRQGYACLAHDHLGHGHTARDERELGFIAEKDGWKLLIEDVQRVYLALPEAYAALPHLVLGHSMGSFIARLYATAYPTALQGLMIMGTGGPNPLGSVGLRLADGMARLFGPRHVSKALAAMAFGPYAAHFHEHDRYCWISTLKPVTARYAQDRYCTYLFTASAMRDLITLNRNCNLEDWFDAYPSRLPTLFLYGSDDPVGDYGKGVGQVIDALKRRDRGVVDARCYRGARHEVLNDFCRETVWRDLTDFCDSIVR